MSFFNRMHARLWIAAYKCIFTHADDWCPKGLRFTPCLSCGNRPLTCDDPPLSHDCASFCMPGCDCPVGKVLDQTTGECVSNECQRCPFEGQVVKSCVNCPWNPYTCDSHLHPCPLICLPGCECPDDEVLDLKGERCVPLEQCL